MTKQTHNAEAPALSWWKQPLLWCLLLALAMRMQHCGTPTNVETGKLLHHIIEKRMRQLHPAIRLGDPNCHGRRTAEEDAKMATQTHKLITWATTKNTRMNLIQGRTRATRYKLIDAATELREVTGEGAEINRTMRVL